LQRLLLLALLLVVELIEAILQQLFHGVAYDSIVAVAGRAPKVIPDHEVKQWQYYPYQDA